ncbi:DASH family cryptochrome [Candidatus Uabimicrobium amorphum]|uniref:Cryptochrome DASH n=1 Tax=Uabimicrobium amorphum TaxID=2596890 RepID=A0A5S9F7R5_UABAM|nr:DASH family cryptochrome [Candidatus Uabimicrobium amorphum]BBM87934.1 cryptochrome DASH [Candidatus Uabimicrobium amorphum]
MQTAILWYRNDLRIHDHEPLVNCSNKIVIPVYCLDPSLHGKTSFGFPKTGVHRTKFILESLHDLRQSLQNIGGHLIVCHDNPAVAIPQLAKKFKAKEIHFHDEVTHEEIVCEKQVIAALDDSVKVFRYWGSTLMHDDDLPHDIDHCLNTFSKFRNRVEKKCSVRKTLPTPKKLNTPQIDSPGDIPTLEAFFADYRVEPRSVLSFTGGESAGQERVRQYLWEEDCLKEYFNTRNGLLGANYSSKFSAWLSLGCVSPRWIYEEVKKYEQRRHKNKSTYWLIFELLWRDFFRFVADDVGNQIFSPEGMRNEPVSWQGNEDAFVAWQEGQTGIPFIDANMRELNATGFMSNRGRQNVASFLTKDLKVNWLRGAEYFESMLIDYDVCSNYGNWCYVAGVGNDPRENRYFNVLKQALSYDPQGDYVRHWLPELAALPGKSIHYPFFLSQKTLREANIQLGHSYANPLIVPRSFHKLKPHNLD